MSTSIWSVKSVVLVNDCWSMPPISDAVDRVGVAELCRLTRPIWKFAAAVPYREKCWTVCAELVVAENVCVAIELIDVPPLDRAVWVARKLFVAAVPLSTAIVWICAGGPLMFDAR